MSPARGGPALRARGLRKTFGDRLTVYPHGGHCGNLNYRVNANAMLEFFARG